ncbi:hypothetical protein BDV93DRAFT_519520 [Ceratobasidium sp. AG-I]|nr:hypothetical protein BDV93DRAFT_519520 [Ceratobasidium sp. AG-I]
MSVTIHSCRWEWCRNVFDTHAELVEHSKLEHLLRARPTTKRDASIKLRAEGYTPEEIARRLIPNYIATQPSPVDDPPHQAPISSPPQVTPQAELDTQEPDQEVAPDQSLAVEPPLSPIRDVITSPAKPPNEDSNNVTSRRDEDTIMPPSSPPIPIPIPSPSPELEPLPPVEQQMGDMSIDEPEPVTETYSHILVPVSSPTSREQNALPSTPARTPRLRRRSSFSQLSSSPPDEFTATRTQPIPESPSTASIIAEREKELREREKERERDRDRDRERGRVELERTREAAEETQREWIPGPRATIGDPPFPPVRLRGQPWPSGRGRSRGRVRGGHSNLQISPERSRPLPSAGRGRGRGRPYDPPRNIPLRRTGELGHTDDIPSRSRPYSPSRSPTRRQYGETQASLDNNDAANRMMSQFTHLESEDEETMLADLMQDLESADLMLQSQAPYVAPTQSTYPSQSQPQPQHRSPDSQRPSWRGRGRGRIQGAMRPRGRGRGAYETPRRGRGRESEGSSNGSSSQRSHHYDGSQRSHESDRS